METLASAICLAAGLQYVTSLLERLHRKTALRLKALILQMQGLVLDSLEMMRILVVTQLLLWETLTLPLPWGTSSA